MRKRLIAIPRSAAKRGVRLDWSPRYREFILYIWYFVGDLRGERFNRSMTYRWKPGHSLVRTPWDVI